MWLVPLLYFIILFWLIRNSHLNNCELCQFVVLIFNYNVKQCKLDKPKIQHIYCSFTHSPKKKKKGPVKQWKLNKPKLLWQSYCNFSHSLFFIYRNIHCTYNVNLYCKHIKIGKCCTHLQKFYDIYLLLLFFLVANVYNICHFLCIYIISLYYKVQSKHVKI